MNLGLATMGVEILAARTRVFGFFGVHFIHTKNTRILEGSWFFHENVGPVPWVFINYLHHTIPDILMNTTNKNGPFD